MNLFKSKKKSKGNVTVPIDSNATIMKIRDNLANQEKREAHLKIKMEKLAIEAKEKMGKGDKRGALFAMKKRKMYDSELGKIENVKMTLETQAISLEGASQNIETVNAMKGGNSAMKSIRKIFGIDQVDELLDNVKEEMDLHQEVNTAFSQPIDPFMADEDELMAELNALTDGEDSKIMSSLWPAAPSKKPTKQTSTDPAAVDTTQSKKSMFALFA